MSARRNIQPRKIPAFCCIYVNKTTRFIPAPRIDD